MERVAIICAKRTPIGAFGGVFKEVSAVELGTYVVKDILAECKISPEHIDEVIVGNVLGAGLGQNVARQIALKSGIPETVTAYTINKVCGSGMKAVALAAQAIQLGEVDVVLAGGVENMSQCPYILREKRWGAKMGDKTIVDVMIHDGLTDIFNGYHMGLTAENLAEQWNITREEQDHFSAASQQKAEAAMANGKFADEITKVVIPQRKGDPLVIDTDEFPRKGVTTESLLKLKPAFKNDGTVTAGNASGINDGAAMLLLTSEKKAKELGLTPLAYWVNYAAAGCNPATMGYGPVPAIKKLMKKTNLTLEQIELCELNEAFAAQSLAVLRGLEKEVGTINSEIINVNGGAISLGHPIGASGARIIVTLLHEMKRRDVKLGLGALCIGGGMGVATVFQR